MIPLDNLPTLPDGPMLYLVLAVLIITSSLPVLAVVAAAEPLLMAVVVLAGHGHPPISALLVVAVVGAVFGDAVSYGLGRWFGPRLRNVKALRRSRKRIAGAQQVVQRRGMLGALVVQRWVPPARGFAPALLGADRQPFGLFVAFSGLAGLLWALVLVLGTHLAGPTLVLIVPTMILALTVLRVAQALLVRRRRSRSQ
ncbi:hypothetical protein FPV58_26880 [Mycolicibacterium porcinum]|uniref:DedA family protein n=1 Tax=Mycolicibacterium porcinum TaxID=39693 RepID=UPI001194A42B|nr:VTT domain-containing protein [Mycolicibacterium porcinum]TVX95709.1 hypothetical protein FPV58_26880 [Mycolicibacterium porcinum]